MLSPLHEQNKKLALNDDVFQCAKLAPIRVYCCGVLYSFFNSHKELHLSSPMSWIKVVSACGDDVFDENADDMTVISNEWVSNMKKRVRVNAGFSVC